MHKNVKNVINLNLYLEYVYFSVFVFLSVNREVYLLLVRFLFFQLKINEHSILVAPTW